MQFENLTKENINLYAIKAYDNPNMLLSEYESDIKRFNYIKRLINKYLKTNIPHDRLILNHIIILYNVFGVEQTTRMLFYFLPENQYAILKSYLLFLDLLPKIVKGINNKTIITDDLDDDNYILKILKEY